MKRVESDGGRYLNSNAVMPFCFVSGYLEAGTRLKSKMMGEKS